ncbi:MAG: hypothetical protein M3N34_07615 [Pseudomonadota bacterium]|nr:hypothetical protein [Pseudomonadota bacterium]
MSENQSRFPRCILVASIAIALSSCHKETPTETPKASPGAACSTEDVERGAIDLIFEKAEGALESQLTGKTDEEILAMVKKMSVEQIFKFDSVTFDHFDDKTGVVGCEAFLSYHISPADLTPAMKAAAKKIDNHGLSVPSGLLDGRAQPTPYHFEVRDALGSQGGKMVESGEDLIEPASAVIRVASVRVVAAKMRNSGRVRHSPL